MVKLINAQSPGSLSRTFKNWLMELAETEMTFDILKRLRADSAASIPSQQPQQEDPSRILSYVQFLKELPEEDRQIAVSLIQSLNQPPAPKPQQSGLDPTLLMLMMLLKDGKNSANNSSGNNEALAEAIRGQFTVLTELIRTMANRNDGGESVKLLLEAIDKLKTNDDFKDEVARMAISALLEAASGKDSDDIDKLFSLMEKLKTAGLIIDPHTSLTYSLEKEKMDKEFQLKQRQMEMEEKRMEQITQFLADLADALESLTEKEEVEKKPSTVDVNCPKCGNSIKVSTDMKEGTVVRCEKCGAKLKLKWRGGE